MVSPLGPVTDHDRLRVLFVSPSGALGGSERSLLDLLWALGETAPHLERALLLLSDGELAGRARALGASVDVLPLPGAMGALGESRREGGVAGRNVTALAGSSLAAVAYAREFRGHVRRLRPHLIHTNGVKAHVLATLAAPDIRRVVHVRDFVSERPLTRRLLPLFGWRGLVVANSEAVARDIRRCAPALSPRVVYNGIDTDEFRPGPATGSLPALAGMAAPAAGTLSVGLVATYAWWKGHRRFLEAAQQVLKAAPGRELRFYVVGGPIYGAPGSQVSDAELRAIVRQLGIEAQVGFVPFQTDAAAIYRELDIVVHASERPEPFGRTIVEAMATGRPVVVARAGGAAELFDEGKNAVGYAPERPGDLARALGGLVADDELRLRIGAAARSHAVERFERRRLGPELLEVYRSLLGTRLD